MATTVDRNTLARLLRIEPASINRLTQASMPKLGRGRYDFAVCLKWHHDYLQDSLRKGASSPDGSSDALTTARVQNLRERVRLKEHNLKELRATLITSGYVAERLRALEADFRRELGSLPARVAPVLAAAKDADRTELLGQAIDEALSRIAHQLLAAAQRAVRKTGE